MRFDGVAIITDDVARSRAFYQQVLQREADGGETHAVFSLGGFTLTLWHTAGMEEAVPGSMQGAGHGGYTLSFEVEDVDREYDRLQPMDLTWILKPTTHAWGRRSVWFRDPDGNIVNFHATV